MNAIVNFLLMTGAFYVATLITPGVEIHGFWHVVVAALVLSLLNLFIKPVLQFLSIPISILTLGLFILVVNGLVILLCSHIVDAFQVESIWNAILFSILFSIVSWGVQVIFGRK